MDLKLWELSRELPVTASQAAECALDVAAWLVSEPEILRIFLSSTGSSVADLRNGLDAAELQAALLDFLLMEDGWVLACAASSGRDPAEFAAARRILPGGAVPHWT